MLFLSYKELFISAVFQLRMSGTGSNNLREHFVVGGVSVFASILMKTGKLHHLNFFFF